MTLTMPSTLSSRTEARDSSLDIAGPSGIQLNRVSVSYRSTEVLKPLTLTIGPRRSAGADRPLRLGKTTVLRAIAGFVQPSAGRIAIR
ncbi:taurine transporter ATP-binding subunit [Serratia marcescens]|uniref:Taurine transporter ATP-binding subunit n=1 Tax=Serratia marcescens TaxID=615 RepID=A0A379ZTH3_SERMA|nr:taurine transporter ATP-binding subunit [Serratia marcescens]